MSETENSQKTENGRDPGFDNRMLPVMREAVLMVQMILYQRLKENLTERHPRWPEQKIIHMAGAVVNNLFGTRPENDTIADFAHNHREEVEAELRGLGAQLPDLVPVLTDGLRMQTICDNQEGIHSIGSLLMARELGLLLEERHLPMPSTFMLAVRRLAADMGLVRPPDPKVSGLPDLE